MNKLKNKALIVSHYVMLVHSLFAISDAFLIFALFCSVLCFVGFGGWWGEDLCRLPFQTAMSTGFASVEEIWRAKRKSISLYILLFLAVATFSLWDQITSNCASVSFQLPASFWGGNLSCDLSFCWTVSCFGSGKPTCGL